MGHEGRPGRKDAAPPDYPFFQILRLDVVLWSEEAKKIILIELTVPWEEECEQAFERKSAKNQDLGMLCNLSFCITAKGKVGRLRVFHPTTTPFGFINFFLLLIWPFCWDTVHIFLVYFVKLIHSCWVYFSLVE